MHLKLHMRMSRYIVSDCDALEGYDTEMHYSATPEDAAALALNAGNTNSSARNHISNVLKLLKLIKHLHDSM